MRTMKALTHPIDEEADREKAVGPQIAENLQHRDLEPIETAEAVAEPLFKKDAERDMDEAEAEDNREIAEAKA